MSEREVTTDERRRNEPKVLRFCTLMRWEEKCDKG
jgi:hypothetical protein